MPKVRMPDGQDVLFPDEMPATEITAFIEKNFPETVDHPYSLGDVGMAALRGIPIAGAAVERLSTPGMKKEYERFDKQHPYISTAAQLGGGVAALGPLGTSATGARLLGLGGRTLLGQIGRSAASGAGITAADAAIRGGDPALGGAIGGAAGAAGPVLGRLASGATNRVAETIGGIAHPERTASRIVGQAAADARGLPGTLTEAQLSQARAAGQPVMAIDVAGQPGRNLARDAANLSPQSQAELEHTLSQRGQGQASRIVDWFQTKMHFPSAHQTEQALASAATKTNAAYKPLFAATANKPLWDEGFEQLLQSPSVQQAVNRAQTIGAQQQAREGFNPIYNAFHHDPQTGRFTINRDKVQGAPNLEFWNEVKKQLDAAGITDGAARQEARILRDRLDEIIPEYRGVREARSRVFEGENAFEWGQNFVQQPFQNEQVAAALRSMDEAERKLFNDGFLSRYVDTLNRVPNRFDVLNKIAHSTEAQQKLRMVLGEQRYRELDAFLHIEAIMQMANNAVRGNSTTARQLAQLGMAGAGGVLFSGGDLSNPSALVKAALIYGAMRGHASINRGVAERVARMLMSDNPDTVANAMKTLSGPAYLSHLRNARAGFAGAGVDIGLKAAAPQIAEAQ